MTHQVFSANIVKFNNLIRRHCLTKLRMDKLYMYYVYALCKTLCLSTSNVFNRGDFRIILIIHSRSDHEFFLAYLYN